MTLNDNAILTIYILIAYTCASFSWLWWRGSDMEKAEEGHWYDWVLCVPVLLLAGVIGLFGVIFTKHK